MVIYGYLCLYMFMKVCEMLYVYEKVYVKLFNQEFHVQQF